MSLKSLALATVLAFSAVTGAQAATLFATNVAIVTDGPRGTSFDRDDSTNALGSSQGDFFELGYGATVDFTFGGLFTGPGEIIETTFGNRSGFLETFNIFVGRNGVFTLLSSATNAAASIALNFNGSFDTLRLVDTSPLLTGPTGGIDIDTISVTAVPVPAGGLLLLGALGGLGLIRRRRAA